MKRRVAYISFWSIQSGLAEATILPSLKILNSFSSVETIYLITLESGTVHFSGNSDINKVKFFPVIGNGGINLLNLFKTILLLARLKLSPGDDLVVCKGSQAGIVGLFLFLFSGVPFIVESFEPHADYMADSGCWRKGGFKYRIQKGIERAQMRHALKMACVSRNYIEKLKTIGILKHKLQFTPCPVDFSAFGFDKIIRQNFRRKLGISDDEIIGIYVGKFGGLYFEEESFRYFASASNYFKKFRLILITDFCQNKVREWADRKNVSVHILSQMDHRSVNNYLCAADFAFTNVKPGNSKMFCCPIKNGEYLACGLPIFIDKKIGDDSDIIASKKFGAVAKSEVDLNECWKSIQEVILENNRGSSQLEEWVKEERSISWTKNLYADIFCAI